MGCNIQNLDYAYNIKGWLKNINNPTTLVADKDYFGMALDYDNIGNIKAWDYQMTEFNTAGTVLQNRGLITQAYTYDSFNRLKTSNLVKDNAVYFELNGLNYDANGNITSLTRKLQNVAVDVLTYSYKPNNLNQIDKVEDTGTSSFFENKNVGSSDYAYDANGNTTKDLNKGITDISYNYLNLMQKVVVNGQTINYLHSSTGQKLNADFGVGKKYDYFGTGVWVNDTLEFVPTAEGRYTKTRGYEYYLKDHLGNLRISCGCKAGKAKIYQENHFDPWGADLADLGISGSVREKFTGKEAQQLTGLIDFGARQYDNLVPHFFGTDPLSEKFYVWSPFTYTLNNPLKYIDKDGRAAITPDLEVEKQANGTYKVEGGTANSDRNIYVTENGKRTGEVIGKMLTEYSFHNENGSAVKGAIINPKDKSGITFMNKEIIGKALSLEAYMPNAVGREKYDFKAIGIDKIPESKRESYVYRGMPFEGVAFFGNKDGATITFASARDFGNVAAGFVAGYHGMSWGASRKAFDGLQSLQQLGAATEGQPTQRAEYIGHQVGIRLYKNRESLETGN